MHLQGLEDQLLDLTMQKEQPRLFQRRIQLVQQQNKFTILLADLENTLLQDISSAEVRSRQCALCPEAICGGGCSYLMFNLCSAFNGHSIVLFSGHPHNLRVYSSRR